MIVITIVFARRNKFIHAEVIGTTIESLDTGHGKQVVFFCRDESGKLYRVPKREAVLLKKVRKTA